MNLSAILLEENRPFRGRDQWMSRNRPKVSGCPHLTRWLKVGGGGGILNRMVEYEPEMLDAIFHALADPTRRAMLQRLAQGEQSVGTLAAPFDMSLAAASKHIKVLERAGLVRRSVRGRTHLCSLDAQPMYGGLEWLRHYEHFWNRRLDDLDEALRAEDGDTDDAGPSREKRSKR